MQTDMSAHILTFGYFTPMRAYTTTAPWNNCTEPKNRTNVVTTRSCPERGESNIHIVYVRGTNTDTQDAGNWDCTCSCKMRESGGEKGKTTRREHVLHMRAQKPTSPGTSTNATIL